jgi:zinc D-Ala-D-Ala carboxypeptidase
VYFSIAEFDCKCQSPTCTTPHISVALVLALERVRTKLGQPIRVTSGLRCAAHNKRVGGVKSSQHLLGAAADITCEPEHLAKLHELCREEVALVGIGDGRATGKFVHVDVRPGERKEWTYN